MATDADYLNYLIAARNAAAQSLADEAVYEAVNGPRPTYSLEGKSYQWDGWREAKTRQIEALNRLIQAAQPGIVVSRARS